jgi:hypothetical protein
MWANQVPLLKRQYIPQEVFLGFELKLRNDTSMAKNVGAVPHHCVVYRVIRVLGGNSKVQTSRKCARLGRFNVWTWPGCLRSYDEL